MAQAQEMPKAYDPKKVEERLYQFWMERGYFTPKIDPKKKPFVIIMPPPNVTGELHLGHALTATIEDIMIRWHRMKGDPTLWLPGIDHAGIAAQVMVERQLAQEGLTRHDLGRERFLERMWQWVEKYRRIMTEQHKRLGASCDWTRERFTLDEGPSRAVRTTFVRLYEKGLIYRGERIINWCPRCTSALSDLEVEHKEMPSYLYYIRYPLANEGGFITVATTRPETILGDTAVAVNPDDPRFRGLAGKRAILPVINREIPIIADSAVDPAFGTGAVKVTPAHDPVDFEIAERHRLPLVNIMNQDASMNENAGPYRGLDRFACREAILADLKREGLLVKIEPYSHSVGHCCRCNTMIEPMVSKQWFVKIAPLAARAIDAVVDGKITIIPERFTKVYLNWLENIRDWCISRQLWWGHRIPVWYCNNCNGLTVSVDEPASCVQCGSPDIFQDPDVLDTWFSSALWPHSSLGWPKRTEDLDYFYPTTVMETGYEILFFWVARMVMMGLENTGEVPFRTVYLHGLIRDEKGEKMSKVKGNAVNPLEAIDKYGTDALRFALSTGTSPGNDLKLGEQKLEASRNFANKLWNAARFVIRSIEGQREAVGSPRGELPVEDRWILSRLNRLVANVNELLEDFQFGEAQRQIHDFLWGEFCDWYIEMAKIRLRSKDISPPLPVLVHVLETSLRLLHPFMPFITEEIWQNLTSFLPEDKGRAESIMIAPYPVANKEAIDPQAEQEMESVIEIIRAIRNARTQLRVEPSRWIEAVISAGDAKPTIQYHAPTIKSLARIGALTILGAGEQTPPAENSKVMVLKGVEVILPMAGMIEPDAERKRLEREIADNEAKMRRLETKLSDGAFLSKAPAEIIKREKERLATYRDKAGRLKERLAQLS